MRSPMDVKIVSAAVIVCGQLGAAALAEPDRKAPARFGSEEPGAWGAPVELEIWGARTPDGPAERIVTLTNDAVYLSRELPGEASFRLVPGTNAAYDSAFFYVFSTDGHSGGWGPGRVEAGKALMEPVDGSLTKAMPGRYRAKGAVLKGTNVVGMRKLYFTIQYAPLVPMNTAYLKGRKDVKGNLITGSKPVDLGALNETPKLKDNDYPFEPQKAFEVVNWERFPPFKLNDKFLTVWDSKRFLDEPSYGGPLSRGFSMVAHELPSEALPAAHRAVFGYPGEVEGTFRSLAARDPKKYGELLNWLQTKDGGNRSPWLSASNVYAAGWEYYNGCSRGGQAECGLFTWDEEEMWGSRGVEIFKTQPQFLPEELKALKAKDPKAESPDTQGIVWHAYEKAWADFLGWIYKGAVDCAASRGHKLTIYHYGSLPIGLNTCVQAVGDPAAETPPTYESLDSLGFWYKNKDGKVDFGDNLFTRTVQYYHKDSYFFYVGPQTLSMYEKDKAGSYVLEANGRRKVRSDVVQDPVYAVPTKVGYEDYAGGPANMKEFIAKQENTLFWLNGGKYYKQSGTLTNGHRPLPTMRPGNQETLGQAAQLGSRPVTPYLAEAAVINNFIIGVEGFYLWDCNREATRAGQVPKPGDAPGCFGDLEFMVKGLHRLSQFNKLFDGQYSFIRTKRQHDARNRNHPIIRGVVNGRYLLLAMSNPFLDFGERQDVEIWYDAPYADLKRAKWHDQVTILPRQNHLFQCKLPAGPRDGYDPDKFYFRYTCVDGNYTNSFTVSGNYDVKCPYEN